jgi:hypothetical protein
MEARSTYELAISSATGKTFGLTRAPYHARDLCDLLNKHAPPVEEQDPFKWLASSAVDWVKVTDPKFSGGWSPSKLLDWLNAGRPDKRERPKSAAEITKQPGDLTAPWLQDDYVGKTGS